MSNINRWNANAGLTYRRVHATQLRFQTASGAIKGVQHRALIFRFSSFSLGGKSSDIRSFISHSVVPYANVNFSNARHWLPVPAANTYAWIAYARIRVKHNRAYTIVCSRLPSARASCWLSLWQPVKILAFLSRRIW